VLIRPARFEDIENIYPLVMYYANQGALLPRSRESLAAHLSQLAVACDNETLAGVVALHRLESHVSEVRSLAVAPRFHKQGIGHKLVAYAVSQAELLGYHKVIAFTRQISFFERCGFQPVARETVPAKYFRDCIGCPMLAHCDEIAMERVLLVPVSSRNPAEYPASLH
jgi:amino-acid N-acetyltransferase